MKDLLNILALVKLIFSIVKEYNSLRQTRKERKEKFRDTLRKAKERAKKKHDDVFKKGPENLSDAVNDLISPRSDRDGSPVEGEGKGPPSGAGGSASDEGSGGKE
jgi:membrane protein involved in colicin uptake